MPRTLSQRPRPLHPKSGTIDVKPLAHNGFAVPLALNIEAALGHCCDLPSKPCSIATDCARRASAAAALPDRKADHALGLHHLGGPGTAGQRDKKPEVVGPAEFLLSRQLSRCAQSVPVGWLLPEHSKARRAGSRADYGVAGERERRRRARLSAWVQSQFWRMRLCAICPVTLSRALLTHMSGAHELSGLGSTRVVRFMPCEGAGTMNRTTWLQDRRIDHARASRQSPRPEPASTASASTFSSPGTRMRLNTISSAASGLVASSPILAPTPSHVEGSSLEPWLCVTTTRSRSA